MPNLGFFVVAALAGWSLLSPASPAHADVKVTVTTTPHGGRFAPRNVFSAWVEDANGNFVKTISRWSANYTNCLVAWNAKAGAGDADAVSGASRQNHQTNVTATWDLKNKAGAEVPDGTYTIRMELADSNATQANQNDQGTYTVVKNATGATQTAVKSGGFTSTIVYTPNASPTCNNGAVDAGETCDPPGSCPTSCAASADACKPNVLVGSASGCTAACVVQAITACVGGDGCCADGCTAANDSDCDGTAGPDGNLTGGCAADGGSQLAASWLLLGLLALTRRRR